MEHIYHVSSYIPYLRCKNTTPGICWDMIGYNGTHCMSSMAHHCTNGWRGHQEAEQIQHVIESSIVRWLEQQHPSGAIYKPYSTIFNHIYIYNLHVETWPDISRCLQYLLPKAMDIVYALKRQGRTIYGFGSWGADGRQRLAPAGTHCYLAQGQPHCTYSIKNGFKRQKNIPQHKDGIWFHPQKCGYVWKWGIFPMK